MDCKLIQLGIMIGIILFSSCRTSGQNSSLQKGFVQIFDGKTLAGWEGDTTYWRVENGSLVGEIKPTTLLKSNSFIVWKGGRPADFELTLEFKIAKSGNSGINYRSVVFPGVPHALQGYQADIDGANNYTGQNYEERGRTTLAYRGEIVTIKAFETASASFQDYLKNNDWTNRTVTGTLGSSDSLQSNIKSENWNTCRLLIKGNRLQHFINGILMSDVTDGDTVNRKSEGLLGVQVHVGPPMKVEYRNIRLRQL